MALDGVKKTGELLTKTSTANSSENVQLPNEMLAIVFFKLAKLNDIHSLLQTSRHYHQCISDDNLLWKDFVKSRFPNSFQKYENADNFKDILKFLKIENRNIDEYKFRTCSWKGHTKKVTCTTSQKDKFASGSEDGTVILWDRHTRKELFKWDLSAHGACTSLAMDVETLYAGFRDGAISSWNANSGEKIHEIEGDVEAIRCLQVDGNKFIYASGDCIKIWDRTKKELVENFYTLANSVGVHKNRLLIGGTKLMFVMDENGKKSGFKQGHDSSVSGLTVQGDRFFSCTGDGDVKCWKIGSDIGGEPLIIEAGNVQAPRSLKEMLPDDLDSIGLIAQEDKIFYVLDDIAVLDFESGNMLYTLESKQATTSACMQDGMLISGSQDGTLTIRDFNFPSLTSYDEYTLEKNLILLGKIADKDDPLCKDLHPKFSGRLQELAKNFSSFSQASLRVKIEVSLHLLLDRIHRGDQKRISEILALPIWNELTLIDGKTTQLYENVKKICIDQKESKTKEGALEGLKQKEQVVMKFIQHLKKY